MQNSNRRSCHINISTAFPVLIMLCASKLSAAAPPIDDIGTIAVPAFDLPESAFLGPETRAVLKRQRSETSRNAEQRTRCPAREGAPREGMAAIRQCEAELFYETPRYQRMRASFDVSIEPREIGGVHTEVFTPVAGVSRKNARRVLVNLHGGGLQGGGRTLSQLESIPIAALGRIKVISVDYRMAPEHTFPAASEDVAAVYRELLKQYAARDIGIFGCSAGAWLTAQSIAWFQKEHLPLPGAIGLFCHGAEMAFDTERSKQSLADSAYVVGALTSDDYTKPNPYYLGVDRQNVLVSPGDYDEVMGRFPPTLLISGTRDFALSGVLVTHAQLTRLGVEAELHVWEGMRHAFHFEPQLPESREAYDVILRFFDARLGAKKRRKPS